MYTFLPSQIQIIPVLYLLLQFCQFQDRGNAQVKENFNVLEQISMVVFTVLQQLSVGYLATRFVCDVIAKLSARSGKPSLAAPNRERAQPAHDR